MEDDEIILTPEFIAEQQRKQDIKDGKIKTEPVPFSLLEDYPGQKFSLYTGQRFDDMVESIKTYGILEPLLVLKQDNRYFILSGRNRRRAAVKAGLTKAPAIVFEHLSPEEAELIISESNLRQRSFGDMSYSERACALADHYNAIKKQGKRLDLFEQIKKAEFPDDSAENETCPNNGKSEKLTGERYNLSHATVAQYIRVATINESLMSMLDEGYIAFTAAYQLAFVDNPAVQQLIADVAKGSGCKISPAKATELRLIWAKKKGITEKEIKDILQGAKPQKMKSAVIKPKILAKYFPSGTPAKEIVAKIIRLLEADAERKDGNDA